MIRKLYERWFRRREDFSGLLVPVIFANGEDDDLPGLRAAIENRRVQFGDRIYEPDEALTVRGHKLRMTCFRLHIITADAPEPIAKPGVVVVREGRPARRILVADSVIVRGPD